MATIEITENEILQELAAACAGKGPKEAKTVKELVAQTGISEGKIRDALGRLAMQDRLEVHSLLRPGIDKRLCHRPAYTVLPPKGKGGRKK